MLDQDILSQTLNMYDGSIADKQMKFFEEYYPFTSGTVQDREFQVLGYLGYTEGGLTGRWLQYITYLGGDLLNTKDIVKKTFYGNAGYFSYTLEDIQPIFIFDPENRILATRELEAEDYDVDGITPVFVFDPENRFIGTRDLDSDDYKLDNVMPRFIFDPENRFTGAA